MFMNICVSNCMFMPYKTSKEITNDLGITAARLKYYRLKGYLKKVKWSPGTNGKNGKPSYDLAEVKKAFFK